MVICNVDGNDMIFTSDGKLLANQGSGGHIYYIGENPRFKTFRTSFLVDHDNVRGNDNFLKDVVKVDLGESLK